MNIMPKKKKVSFRCVWDTHLKPSLLDAKCTTKHIQEMELYLARWEAFWSDSKEPKVQNCEREQWPPSSFTGVNPADWWRCAIVLYRTYGFRPQELLAYDPKKIALRWSNITFSTESPNPSSEQTNEHGWLFYVPPKTRKKKPHMHYLPLTKHARAALEKIAATRIAPDAVLFPMPNSQQGFLRQWYEWFESAEVKPKIDGARFKPYAMRKTCATHLANHRAGLATAVCRWGSSGDAKVANEHYIQDDLLLQELHTAPMPRTFDELFPLRIERN